MNSGSLDASFRNRLAILAVKDDEFRKALLADPSGIAHTKFNIPAGTTIRVVEVDPATSCIVIPSWPTDWPSALSVSDVVRRLEAVLSSSAESNPTVARAMLSVIARAMIDNGYATRLLGDPVATLRADGINVPDGVEVIAVRETATESVVIIPTRPPNVEVGNEELDDTAIILREPLEQTQMSDGSWPFRCSNPPTWCPSCQKD